MMETGVLLRQNIPWGPIINIVLSMLQKLVPFFSKWDSKVMRFKGADTGMTKGLVSQAVEDNGRQAGVGCQVSTPLELPGVLYRPPQ